MPPYRGSYLQTLVSELFLKQVESLSRFFVTLG